MKLWHIAAAAAIIVALFGAYYFLGSHSGGARAGVFSTTAWQRMALPGELPMHMRFWNTTAPPVTRPAKV